VSDQAEGPNRVIRDQYTHPIGLSEAEGEANEIWLKADNRGAGVINEAV
jgi:hypothetical protein